jgi:hypothetical protein
MGEGRCVEVLIGKQKGRDHLEDLGVDGRNRGFQERESGSAQEKWASSFDNSNFIK